MTDDIVEEVEVEVEQEKSLVTAGGEGSHAPVVVSEEVKMKKTRKTPDGKVKESTTTVARKTKRALEAGEGATGSVVQKAKKAKKTST